MRNQKGITLIALVITIIVLLILAGVSIAMLTGNNGILTNSNKAKSTNVTAQAEEQMKLAYMAVRTEIMAQTVDNSSYDATATANMTALGKIVAEDLVGSDTTVTAFTGTDKGYQVKVSGSKIIIRYYDTSIDASYSSVKQDKLVYGTIDVTTQGASFAFNTTETGTPGT